MKYKEFRKWCSDRTFDGCWGMNEAIICCNIISDIDRKPFWKREKKWKEIETEIVNKIVFPTNILIQMKDLSGAGDSVLGKEVEKDEKL